MLLLGVPVVFRPHSPDEQIVRGDALRLIIITPHNEQIRYEFARAFDLWHQRNHGQRVDVIYNVPGGTSEIRKMLESQFAAAIESGREPGGDADLVFGGGTFEHGRLKRGVRVHLPLPLGERRGKGTHEPAGSDGRTLTPHPSPSGTGELASQTTERWEPITTPVDLSDQWLAETYGENRIGDDPLYDPDKHWFGLALSGFGIVYNKDVLQTIGVKPPSNWDHLCDPKLQNWVALVNPNQSGSVTTAFESIFKQRGWEEGWRILRRAGANSRYFSASSLKPPMDVSQGNAAMGVCIDFFGRYQSQALKEAGDPDRIGYVDPPGGTLDSDPISMLRNAPNPELAKRFIEFCLSDEGQALWQFRKQSAAGGRDAASLTDAEFRAGPERFELRRMPIVRTMYDRYFDRFVDRVNPFELAQPARFPDPNFRDFIAPMFAAMVMDNHRELKQAWSAIVNHPDYAAMESMSDGKVLTSEVLRMVHRSASMLDEMIELFDAMPVIEGPEGSRYSLDTAEHLSAIRNGWLRGKWADQNLWASEASPVDEMRKRFGRFFRDNYRRIVELAERN